MSPFEPILPAPAGVDKKLQTQYQQLAAEAGELAGKRNAANARWRELAAEAREAHAADAAPLRAEMIEIEIAALEREIPLLERVPGYLQAALALRHREIAVARETVGLAEAHVRAIFDRDFPPQRWPAREEVLTRHIANHAVVLGATDRLSEVNTAHEAQVIEPAKETARGATARLAQLKRDLPAALEAAAKFKREAAARAEQNAADSAAQKQRDDERVAAQKKAADEARKRLGA